MVEALSPLGPAYRPGAFGNLEGGPSVTLSEPRPGSIVQVAAFRGREAELIAAVALATGLELSATPGAGVLGEARSAFGIGPGRFLLVDRDDGLSAALVTAIRPDISSVTDLGHGRTAIRIAGSSAGWVLSKLFAIDFDAAAFPVGSGRATQHHDIFAQMQRTGPDAFDLYVFRSFARSFWTTLCHAAEEVGYQVP